ncbi:isoleucine--tRNA ligase, cytoplasmic, partial [Tanacetum coccineum]
GGSRIEESVNRMMTIIDHARNIRERHKKPLKIPLREMVVVHTNAEFLDDIAGKLREYVLEELNVKSVVPCNDPLMYATLRAEPDYSVLGKRLGKSMRVVAEAIKAMSQEDILSFEEVGEITITGHCLKRTDKKIVRGFKPPPGVAQEQMDASGDGDVLVIMDLRDDDSLFEAGFARAVSIYSLTVVNHVQKLRKKSGLAPTDSVEVYFSSLDDDKSVSARILQS